MRSAMLFRRMRRNRLVLPLLATTLCLVTGQFSGLDCSAARADQTSTATRTEKKDEASESKRVMKRLPRYVLPSSYQLFIEPDIEDNSFSGHETIRVTVSKATDEIAINANDLEIESAEAARIDKSGHGEWLSAKIEMDPDNQQCRFVFDKSLAKGDYELKVKFAGKFNPKLVGFYLSKFTDSTGKERQLASTQMEPTDARRVFPCFDEPDMKATFKVSLSVDPDLVAISNGALAFDKLDQRNNRRVFTFAETPKMSTYLVALIVGPFEATDEVVVDGVKVKVWATRGKKDQGIFGRDVAAKLLPYFQRYFGVDYPLNKLDLIAIPDFSPGAMENLGAITFRESRLLVDLNTVSTSTKQSVASVIAHEMAHMWFGDLVTMKWWDDLWLNEAFATWMSVKAMNFYNPEWRPWDSFVEDRASALYTDCLLSTRPIYSKVSNPSEAEEMFDEITYEKGASVLRMLERFLGDDVYMKGIQQYIESHKYGNAATSELWESLEKVSGKPVGDIMKNWVYEPGYPVVDVKLSDNGKELTLEQKRFLVSSTSDAGNIRWQIPVGIKAQPQGKSNDDAGESKDDVQHVLFNKDSMKVDLEGADSFLLANADADGYFRVRYPRELLAKVSESADKKLSVKERYQLLSDAWAMVEVGSLPISDYMMITANFRNETDPNVIKLLVQHFEFIDLFVDESSRPAFAAFVRDRLGPLSERLGWEPKEGESDLTRLLRGSVLSAMGTLGEDKSTIEEARKKFSVYVDTPEKLEPNLYDAIVGIVAYNGSDEDYELLEKCWRSASTPDAKIRNLMALADFRRQKLLSRTLNLALSSEVRTQDAPHLVLHLMARPAGRSLGWSFVKTHWTEMENRFPAHLFPRIVKGAYSFVSPEQSADLEKFLSQHPMRTGRRVTAKVLERVKLNVKMNDRSSEALANWLKEFNKDKSSAG